jgi:flagellar basal body-associated protein FliL
VQNDDAEPSESAPKKAPAKTGKMLLILGAVLATGGSAAAGALIGPGLVAKSHAAPAASASAAHESDEAGEAAALDPIIVDVREANGEMHHLKVGIAIELGKGVTEEEWKRAVPRIRDAAISYLRSLKFDDIASSAKFDPIRTELGERIAHAAGKIKVHRVLFTDFVAQ